jgi:hypothetical protein
MELRQRPVVLRRPEIDLEERVCLIVELWGEGEALDEDRIVEVAGNLYGIRPEEVRRVLVENLKKGLLKGKFYVPNESPSKSHR